MALGPDHNMLYAVCVVYASLDYDRMRCLLRGVRHRARHIAAPKPGLRVFYLRHRATAPIDPHASLAKFCKGMTQSKKLLLIASPESARSRYATAEIRQWLTTGSADDIIIAHTRGTLDWDAEAGKFDRGRSSAIVPFLHDMFTRRPVVLDMTGVPAGEGTRVPRTLYDELVRSTAAAILDCPESEIVVDPPRSTWPSFASGA